jgi:hypothetical protein
MSERDTSTLVGIRQSTGFAVYGVGAIAWLATAYGASFFVPKMPLWFFVVATLLTALPIVLAGVYTSTIAQLRTIAILTPGRTLHGVLSGRVFRSVLWTLWGFASAVLMILNFSTNTWLEWVALGLAIPVFWVALRLLIPAIAWQIRHGYLVMGFSIAMARWICAAITVALYGLLIWIGGGIESHGSLAEALAAKRATLPEQTGNSIVQVGLQLITLKDGAGGHYAALLDHHLAMALSILNSAALYFGWAASLACFAIRPVEYRRVFGPLSDSPDLPPVSNRRIAAAAAIFTFVALFIFVPTMTKVEELVKSHQVPELIKQAERKLERIDGDYFEPGTIEQLEAARARAFASISASLDLLEAQVDRGFDRMELSVDAYLDWYYSLPAEYMRIAKLLTGGIERYMAEELEKRLKQKEAFAVIDEAINKTLASHGQAIAQLERETREILDANRVSPAHSAGAVVRDVTLADVLALPAHVEAVALKQRLTGSVIAAGTAGVVAAAVTKKVIGKGMFKAAAQALGKLAASKAASTLTGMGIGAVAGTIVPGVGNAVGAVVGGAIGAVVGGVIVDAGLLKLEEAISREKFKQEILSAIRETRDEFKKKLFPKE